MLRTCPPRRVVLPLGNDGTESSGSLESAAEFAVAASDSGTKTLVWGCAGAAVSCGVAAFCGSGFLFGDVFWPKAVPVKTATINATVRTGNMGAPALPNGQMQAAAHLFAPHVCTPASQPGSHA